MIRVLTLLKSFFHGHLSFSYRSRSNDIGTVYQCGLHRHCDRVLLTKCEHYARWLDRGELCNV